MRCCRVSLIAAVSICLICMMTLPLFSEAGPASPHPAVYGQPDGSKTPELFLRGDERYAWLSDSNGYTIIQDSKGWFVYAQKTAEGNLEPMDGAARVGQIDPESLGLQPNLLHDYAFDDDDDHDNDGEELLRLRQRRKLAGKPRAMVCDHEASSVDPCYLKQLALLVRFADHETRNLPSPEDINVLFNHNGPTGTNVAPTGSIADVYRANSFDTFVLDTHVSGWIQISKTEEYCSGGQNGFNLKVTRECWAEALKMYADTLGADGLSMFDGDLDGYIDGMAVVHSGAAAESNGEDCESGAVYSNRIWSHAVPNTPNFEITNEFSIDVGVKTGRFYVFSAVHGNCPEGGVGTKWEPGRIAVGVHEGGHFLGLKDLYGKEGVHRGIGNWGFMGNAYGWDASENYPGLMSGYSRHLLGWLDVVDITHSQEIAITSSCDSDQIYRISHRMGSDEYGDEYLLIENRQACGHDVKLQHDGKDRQGIVIFHVDHTGLIGEKDGFEVIRFNTAKAPTDPEWPMVHARVSVLQGDGDFDLETNENRGDDTDSFRVQEGAGKVAKMITNDGVTSNKGNVRRYPNTKSIAYGEERETGIIIEILDKPQNIMRVKVTLLDENGASIAAPKTEAEPEPELEPEVSDSEGPSDAVDESDADPDSSVGAENAESNSITQVGGSTSSIFNRFSYNGDAPEVTDPTESPVASPSDDPVATVTEAPAEVEGEDGETFSCDNSKFEEFQVTGLGETPEMNIVKQCQFINPEKRDPNEWCNAADLWNDGLPVYIKCQQECSVITSCSSPDDAAVALPTDVSVRTSSSTDAPVASQTDDPVVLSTDAPIALSTDAPMALPIEAPFASPTDAYVAPVVSSTDTPVASPTDAPIMLPSDAQVASPTDEAHVAPRTDPPVTSSTDAPGATTTEAPVGAGNEGQFSCDNSKFEEFEFTGLGANPEMNMVKQCQFINPEKRDPNEWCNTADFWNDGQPVYMKCQRECSTFTGCPPPDLERRQNLRH